MAVNDYEPGSMVITHVQGGGRDIIQYIPARSSYGTPPFVPPGPSPYVGTGMQEYRKLRSTLDKSHSELKKNLKNETLKEVDELKNEAGLPGKAVSANDIRDEKSIVDALMDAKAKSLKVIEDRPANLYTASDFPQKSESMYQSQLLASRKFYGEFLDRHMSELAKAYSADIYKEQIAILKQTSQELENKARSLEAEAQRAAAEVEADYKARKANVEKKVQSELDQTGNALPQLTNPTPEQWLERATQLVTQAIANKKKLQTANNALIAKAPNALEKQKATYNADLLVDEIASLQARLDKLNAETARRKEIARQAAIRAANTYAMPANGSVVATAAGRGLIQVAQGAASLAQAISDAIAVLGRVLASAPSVMAVGFASLTYSSRTAEQWQDQTPDSVRYALGMDAAKLGLPPSVNLNAVAKASGTVDLPMRLTNEARGNTTTLSVVSTDGVSVPKAVPVRMAAYNATTGLYEVTVPSTTAEAPPLILTWTPASPPGNQNPSSTTPVVPKPVPVYEGVTLTPLKTEPESYPGVLLDLNDLIVIFPADSGVKPVYVMLSSPLDSGIFTRRQLQKKFDSHKYDFGLGEKSANNGTLAEFRDKILEHLADPATVEKGTYHSEVKSKVHYNARTNIVVIIGEDGMFVSGWRIEPGTDQYNFYMKNEVL
ncbi:HNH nuclease [Pseudomonas aeruginosa]|nr:pyocin-S2 [Pseudomonas aeruginosa BWHPSA037]KAB5409090.1 HNH nuclease [Pseudomonas aeruginosa]KSL34857.1 HNH nuclease [Pseudomonas aeruginosa]KSN17056.1 HNH nuclease [Pseudomonas aeruginosa]MCO2524967.1 HNH nuclease [Pseudomonas aeruginosa]